MKSDEKIHSEELNSKPSALYNSFKELDVLWESQDRVLLLLNKDWKIVKSNRGINGICGLKSSEILGLRSGDILGCIYKNENELGCGYSRICNYCKMKNTIMDTFYSGKEIFEVTCVLDINSPEGNKKTFFLLTTSKLIINKDEYVLLSIENQKARKTNNE